MSSPSNLVEILHTAPGECAAAALLEAGICIKYKGLREQAMTLADFLAAAGIGRGDRVATKLFREGK